MFSTTYRIRDSVKKGEYHVEVRCRGAHARFAKGSLIVT